MAVLAMLVDLEEDYTNCVEVDSAITTEEDNALKGQMDVLRDKITKEM